MIQAYRVLRDLLRRSNRVLSGETVVSAGDTVYEATYEATGYDYGLASDDTRHFGVERISVSLRRNGGHPSFTIPLKDLEPIDTIPLGPLTEQHVDNVCKPGTTECCRYLTMSAQGWNCAKHTHLADTIDERVRKNEMNAVGDNCEGRDPL